MMIDIVRCAECVFWQGHDRPELYTEMFGDGDAICSALSSEWEDVFVFTPPEGFCYLGSRKEV